MGPTTASAVECATGWKRLPGLRVREVSYRAGAIQSAHRHAYNSLSLVLAGEIEETSAQATYRAAAGSLVVKPAGSLHADSYGPRGARVVQVIAEDRHDLWQDARWKYRWRDGPRFAPAILALITAGRGVAETAELALWDIVEGAFPLGRSRGGRPPAWWADAVDLLNACPDQSISVAGVARRVGVHPVHLARVCRRQFGCTVRQYIRQRRVLAAWRACGRGEASLASIAAGTGFADQAHMTRAFGDVLGVSPAQLRRLIAG